jgi:hypothetical protein
MKLAIIRITRPRIRKWWDSICAAYTCGLVLATRHHLSVWYSPPVPMERGTVLTPPVPALLSKTLKHQISTSIFPFWQSAKRQTLDLFIS